MRQFKLLGVALGAALLVAACGGGGDGDQTPAIKYTAVVSFGDSLSDAGTYKVGPVAALGGGMFTVNGIAGAPGAEPVPSYNWAQLVSAAAVGKVNCAARMGGFGVAVTSIPGCTNYAQGGSRVKNPVGVGNQGGITAALTEPITTQVSNFLADGNKISGSELITVLAGANDLFAQTEILSQAATAAGGQALATSLVTQLVALAPASQTGAAAVAITIAVQTEAAESGATATSIIGAAITAAATHAATNGYSTTAVQNAAAIGATAGAAATAAGNTYAATTGAQNAAAGMVQAATDLVTSVKLMISLGAKRVVVVNIPDVSQTPMAMATPASQQGLVLALTQAFNSALQAGLNGTTEVVFVDAFAENRRQLADPAHYSLSNVKDIACNLDKAVNPLASSLTCNSSNLVAGNTSRYLFADGVHPTPYGHKLLAQYVSKALVTAGWL
jgi:outer membrane lipase/esterase